MASFTSCEPHPISFLSLISLSLSLFVCLFSPYLQQRSNLTSVSDVDGSEYIPTDDGYEHTASLWLCEYVCVQGGGGGGGEGRWLRG